MTDKPNLPQVFWHCYLKLVDRYGVQNDMSYPDLERMVLKPWAANQPFVIDGKLVRSNKDIVEIKVTQTESSLQTYADQHNAQKRAAGISDRATDRRLLPVWRGKDYTFELLLSGGLTQNVSPDAGLVVSVCQRLPKTAQILATRSRKGKAPYVIEDEYDVQDLLHATLRAFIKYSVQEDPLAKVAGAKSSRADISIEELGTLIEVKYVHGPADQKRLFEEFSQDLVLYAKWSHLKMMIYLIYNSNDLRDPEAFEKLSGDHEVNGKRFQVKVILD